VMSVSQRRTTGGTNITHAHMLAGEMIPLEPICPLDDAD
jgi:hypothetical protein